MKRADADPAETIFALNFSTWKRRALRCCFPGRRVVFVDELAAVPAGAQLAVWGMDRAAASVDESVEILRVEDGFLRSVGLGTDLVRPLSWVVDRRGMYYDATRPSDLEALLAHTAFSEEILLRAAALRQRIVAEGHTKYNVGWAQWERPPHAARVILVPGQVESDQSLSFGAPGVRTNVGLLQAVREAHPQAYIVYKPHPDVAAGLRAAGVKESEAIKWCDELVQDVGMSALLAAVDEVHVLTSLTGFEALLRDKPVTCHGQPFYAGWGLTADKMPIVRRQRRLTLDELVAGALILYPFYLDRAADRLVAPEQALDELQRWRAQHGGNLSRTRELMRVGLRHIVGVR